VLARLAPTTAARLALAKTDRERAYGAARAVMHWRAADGSLSSLSEVRGGAVRQP